MFFAACPIHGGAFLAKQTFLQLFSTPLANPFFSSRFPAARTFHHLQPPLSPQTAFCVVSTAKIQHYVEPNDNTTRFGIVPSYSCFNNCTMILNLERTQCPCR